MNIRPLKDNLVVERVEKELKSESGIILTSSDEADRAKVIAVGPEVTDVKVGDEVLLNWQKCPAINGNIYKANIEDVVGIFE
jgi:co-chaperonin GroES (HSP10)